MSAKLTEPLLLLGTSSFTAEGWEKSFYPKGTEARDYLSYYATQFPAVEVDATFYRIPALSTVKGWYTKTPTDFLFALKAPQEITHEKVLVDTEPVLKEFFAPRSRWAKNLASCCSSFPISTRRRSVLPRISLRD